MRSRQAARSIVAVTLTGAITVFGASGADATAPSDGPFDDEPMPVDPAGPGVVPTLLTGVLDLAGNVVGSLVPAPPPVAPSSSPSLSRVAPADLPTQPVTTPLAAAPVGTSALPAQSGPVPPLPVDCPDLPLGPTAGVPGGSPPPVGGATTAGPASGVPQAPGVQQRTPSGLSSSDSLPDPCAVTTDPQPTQQLPRQLPQLPQPPTGSTQPPADDSANGPGTGDDRPSRTSDQPDAHSDEPSDEPSDE